jgi:hypothetical protein
MKTLALMSMVSYRYDSIGVGTSLVPLFLWIQNYLFHIHLSKNFEFGYRVLPVLKGAGTLVDVLQLSYSFHQNWSKLGTAITENHKN